MPLLAKLRSLFSLLEPFSRAKLGRHHSPSPSFLPDPPASLSLTSSHYVAVPFKPLLMISTLDSGHHRCSSSCATKQVRKVIQLKNNTFQPFFPSFLSFFPRLFANASLFWGVSPRTWCHIAGGSLRMGMGTAGGSVQQRPLLPRQGHAHQWGHFHATSLLLSSGELQSTPGAGYVVAAVARRCWRRQAAL